MSCLEKPRSGDVQPTCSIKLLLAQAQVQLCGHGGGGTRRGASLRGRPEPGRAVGRNTWADECYLMVCCCRGGQGTGQAVRAGQG